MPIIRKKLFAGEISPPNLRYDETCNCFERSPDGGTTWIENPGDDARHNDAYRLPALVGDHRCDVAARITAQLQEALASFILDATLALATTSILNVILLLVGPVGWFVDLIIATGTALAAIGLVAIEAAFTETVWDEIKCIIYNNIDENGQMSAAQADAIYAEIFANYSGTISGTYAQLNNLFGEVMFSNAGVERTETGDCTECDEGHCYIWDFEASDGGWAIVNPPNRGEYSSGNGWLAHFNDEPPNNNVAVYIQFLTSSGGQISRLCITYDCVPGSGANLLALGVSGGTIINTTPGSGTDLVAEWNGLMSIDDLQIQLAPSSNAGASGSGLIKQVRIEYPEGSSIAGIPADNCVQGEEC